MPRPEKVQAVSEIKERIEEAQAVFLAEYAGLSVKDQQELRRALRANGAEFKVVKMTLARRATDDLDIDSLDELLLGPTGLAFADGDPVGAARVLKEFSRGHEVFVVKGGLLGLEFLSPEKISELADIEPHDVLLARLAGAMKAPMANLAGLLAALPRNTASVLQQLLEKKEAAEPSAASPQPSVEGEDDAEPEAATPDEASVDESSADTDAETVTEIVETEDAPGTAETDNEDDDASVAAEDATPDESAADEPSVDESGAEAKGDAETETETVETDDASGTAETENEDDDASVAAEDEEK